MISFDIPANLNGTTLIAELSAVAIKVANNPSYDAPVPTVWEGKLWLDIDSKDKAKAESVVAAHNG